MSMPNVIKTIAVVIMVLGGLYTVYPAVLKAFMGFFRKGRRIYVVGLIRFALAVVFLFAAQECDITWLVLVFGIVFIISGVLIFVIKPETWRGIFEWYISHVFLLRVVGVITAAAGALMLYAA